VATREQIGQALKNAHAAGDTEAARKLADAYQRMRAAPQSPQEAPEGPSMLKGLGRGAESLASSFRTTAGALFGDENEAALAGLERQRQIGEEYGEGASLSRVIQSYKDDGVLPAIGTAIGQTPAALTEQAPQLAATYGLGKAGATLGARLAPATRGLSIPIGAGIGALLSVAPQIFSSNVQRQAQAQQEADEPVDVDLAKAGVATAAQVAPELAATYFTLGGKLVKRLLGIADDVNLDKVVARDLTGEDLARLQEAAKGSRLAAVGRGAGRGAAFEASTEVAQKMIERAQAGLDVLSPEAIAEYGEDAYLGATLGGVFGGAARVGDPGRAQDRLRDVAEEEAQDEFTALEQEIAVDGDWRNMGQPELPGLEPVRAPTTTAGEAQQEAARQYELGTEEYRTRGGEQRYARPGTLAEPTLPTVVNDLDAFNYMKEQGLTEATALDTLSKADKERLAPIKAQMNETALVEMAAAEAARVPRAPGEAPLVIDTSKRIAEFDPAEREVLDRVVERIQSKAPAPGTQQRLPKALTNILMGEEATAAKAKEAKEAQDKADKEAQKAQAAADKEAQRADTQAQKLDVKRAKAAQDPRRQQALDLGEPVDLAREVAVTEGVDADAEQQDLFGAATKPTTRPAPTTLTRMPDNDADINALMQELGAKKTAKPVFKKISGADLTDSAQYDKVVTELDKSAQNTSVEANRNAVVKLAERIRAQGRPQAPAAPAVVDELGGDVIDTTTQRVEETTKDVQVPTPTKRTRTKKAAAPATAVEEPAAGEAPITEGAARVEEKPKAKGARIKKYTEDDFFGDGVSEMQSVESLVSFLERDPSNKSLQKLAVETLKWVDIDAKTALLKGLKKVPGALSLENASNSPKLEGDLLAAVQAGNLKKTISLLLDKTAKRPEVQQILKRIQSMGLKTKIVVGAVPDAGLPMFAGPTALSADIASLAEVQQLLASGADPEQVRQDTGWFKGTDGKWRFEISDSDARMITPVTELIESPLFGKATKYKLSEVLDHPALYAAYPDAADIDFVVRKGFMDFGGLQGSFDGANQIQVTPYAKDPESTILHEVQHWVQTREGFAQGGNESSAIDAVMSTGEAQKIAATVVAGLNKKLDVLAETERLVAAVPPGLLEAYHQAKNEYENHPSRDLPLKERMADPDYSVKREEENRLDNELRAAVGKKSFVTEGPEWEAFSELRRRDYAERAKKRMAEFVEVQQRMAAVQSGDIDALRKAIKDSGQAYNLYRRLAGEIEARNTQARQKMTPAERIYNPPEVTADVKADEAIVVMFGEDTAAIPAASIQPTSTMFAPQKAGSYDPVTDTITLDPELGLNEHTLIHELSHAALAERIADPKSKEAKAFGEFFQIVKNQLGGTYGGTDVQEFAAELMGNEQFAASLKAIKAPKGGSLLQRIVQAIAEFFGFRKGQSAYDAGIKYINELLNVPASAEPTLTEKLFMGSTNPKSAAEALTELGLGRKRSGKKAVTGLAGGLKNLADSQIGGATLRPIMRGVFGLLRTQNIYSVLRDMGPKFQPMARAVKALGDAAEARLGYTEQQLKIFEDKYQKMLKPAKQYAVAMKRMFTMAEDAMRAGLDILDPEFKPTAQQQETYNRLQNVLNNLPAPVRGIYTTLRKDYDDSYKAARELLLEQYADNPTLRAEMRKKFEAEHPRIGYIPSMRFGDFVLEYTDKGTGRRTVAQFESASEREKAIDDLKLAEGEYEEYSRMADVTYSADKVSSTVVKQIMDSIAAKGASKGQLDAVYQVYLSTFPTESYAKRMMRFKDVAGASDDMLRAYANTMTQWVRHTASAKYLPRIEAAMKDIRSQSGVGGVTTEAIADTLAGESAVEFQRNPTFNAIVSGTTTVSYAAYILGNVSSALINLTALPIGYAQLAARYGAGVAYDTMTKAVKIATPISLKDMVGTENAWGAIPTEYKPLIQKLLDQGQLQHTQTREILEGRGKRTEESGGAMGAASQLGVDIMDYGSRPFSAAEKINRAAIAIAAYDAALKGGNGIKPMTKSAAMEYALEVVKDVNTSGTAATGPQLFQTSIGRVVGTFKGFAMNQAFIIARSAYLTFRGADPETRRLARRHVLSSLAVTTALSGVSGAAFVMPSVAVVSSLMQAMFGDDDDDYEYFNSDEWMRDITTSLEQQFRLPEDILYKGLFNSLTGLAVADRAAITENLFFREDPKLVEDIGYVRAMLIQLLGPSVGYGVSLEQGIVLANQGEWGRAMEKILPVAVGNFFKGWRFLNDKTALTQDGEPIVENIDKFYAVMQMGGLAPAELSMRYEERQMAAEFDEKTQAYKDQILDALWAARQSGDDEAFEEAREKLVALGRRYPGLVKPDTIRSSFNSRMVNLRDNVAGLTIPPAIRAEALRRFRLED